MKIQKLINNRLGISYKPIKTGEVEKSTALVKYP